MTAEEFGAKLKEYRQMHFLTQEQMGELLELSSKHIGTLEHGHKLPRASTVKRFQKLLEEKDWKELDVEKLRSEESAKTYARLWKGLKRLEPEQREEMLRIFSQIIGWL